MTRRPPVFLAGLGITCALGTGPTAVRSGLLAGRQDGMVRRDDLLSSGTAVTVGAVTAPLPAVGASLAYLDSRNAQLLLSAATQIAPEVEAAVARVGADRVAVVMGSSTSGIGRGEEAVARLRGDGRLPPDFDMRRQEMGSVAELLALHFGLLGPAYTISTACSSGAQALAAARRLLLADVADVVLAGGADQLCRLTVNGFHALSALSRGICNPFSQNRDGTTIGEGAALFLVRREPAEIALLGVGSASDAHSMTAPEPDGRGLQAAIAAALTDAGVTPAEIDYIQLHGTGTEQNDAMESRVVRRMFGDETPCSSSKPQVGHTLGAAGALAAAACWLSLGSANPDGRLPPHLWDGVAAPDLLGRSLVRPGQTQLPGRRPVFLANASAFGGNNISLVLGSAP